MSAAPENLLPSNRDENWRYTNLRPIVRSKPEAVAADEVAPPALPAALAGFERWICIDGHFRRPPSGADSKVARALDTGEAGPEFAAMLDGAISEAGIDFALARRNAAHGTEVLHVSVPDDAHARLEVVFLARAGAEHGTSYPRLQVQTGRRARLHLIERHASIGADASVINAALDIGVGPQAEVTHVRVQTVAEAATCFDTLAVNVGEQGAYLLQQVTLGALASRSTAFIRLAGRAARCELDAASVATGIQNHDVFAEIEHVGAGTTTRERYRGIATDRGKLAFNGKMIVRASAEDADSDQSLKSLLTGSGAEAAARPQLEIYTDKVRARHGATTGKLDDQMLFYLLSRGLAPPTARALLQWAFIEDAVTKIEPEPLRREVEALIAARLLEVSALGVVGTA